MLIKSYLFYTNTLCTSLFAKVKFDKRVVYTTEKHIIQNIIFAYVNVNSHNIHFLRQTGCINEQRFELINISRYVCISYMRIY